MTWQWRTSFHRNNQQHIKGIYLLKPVLASSSLGSSCSSNSLSTSLMSRTFNTCSLSWTSKKKYTHNAQYDCNTSHILQIYCWCPVCYIHLRWSCLSLFSSTLRQLLRPTHGTSWRVWLLCSILNLNNRKSDLEQRRNRGKMVGLLRYRRHRGRLRPFAHLWWHFLQSS